MKKKIFQIIIIFLLVLPNFSFAWSENAIFFVDPDYDLYTRDKIEGQLLKTTNKLYFYADKNWYQNLAFKFKLELDSKIYNLATEFEYKIYPTLTNLLGSEDNPGVDNDSRIVIVLEPIKNNFGGYIRSGDQYFKNKYSLSNEGQIIYLNADLFLKADLNFLIYELAHEFAHLITLKQKPEADTWFHELISEFAGQYVSSDHKEITKKRAQGLLYSTEVSLLNWKNTDRDYGMIYLFALYLKEQFKEKIFAEALNYPSNDGLICLNEALKRRGTDLDEVFLNWLITNLYNTCKENDFRYCYRDSALKDFSVFPFSYYLPIQENSLLSVTDSIYRFQGKWQKINGGSGTVRLKFNVFENTPIYKVPYIVESINGLKTLGFIDLSKSNISEVYINSMNSQNKAIYFIPFLGMKGLDNKIYYYSFEIQNLGNNKEAEQKIIQQLLQQIEELKRKINVLLAQRLLNKTYQTNPQCLSFKKDLYYGMKAEEVKCLQVFLANLGDDIYPEKLITGYYGPLTMAAVKRFQAKYNLPQTGYFGPLTRLKANQEL